MSKKVNSTEFIGEYYSDRSKKEYEKTIRKYESFHGMTMDELVAEALTEQREGISEDMLSIYDRLMDWRSDMVKDLKYNTIVNHISRIVKIYKMNRVRIPYLPPLNPKRVKRSPTIEYEDLLTKDELKRILNEFNPEERIRAMAMITGGFATNEADHLTREQFFEDLRPYHQCDDYWDAMEKLSQMDNVVWVTKLMREKTKKPYYGLVNPETVQAIAQVRMNDSENKGKLFEVNKAYFGRKCTQINKKLNLGYAGDKGRLTSHSFRRFHATHIRGASLSYEEQLKVSEVDELQGRGKTKTQDTYMKVSKMHQKLLYCKVMNNVSLFNQYEYEIVDDDVVVRRVDSQKEVSHLKEENQKLKRQLKNSGTVSPQLQNLIDEMGKDNFVDEVSKLLSSL